MTEFRAPAVELARFRLRVVVAAVFVLVCFGLLAARFHHLQVKRHDYFLTRAEDNRIALLPVVPHRGTIVDRKGVVLARNYATYTLEITPSQVRDLDATLDELASLLPIDGRDRRRFRKLYEESRNFESVPLRSRLTDEEVARVVSQRYRLPGVDVKARLLRDYPQGTTASHVIGYIGRITERDVERIEEAGNAANYRGSQHMGKAGLEQSYEHELHGTTGFEQVEVNAGGRAVRALSHTPATSGNDLELTLDIELQKVAEKAFGDRRGALVAIEPSTGGVLALASMPTYDPNLFVDGISTQDWKALNDSPDHPMLHRAIYSTYPPGSTFKPFMALAGLETGKRTARQAIHDVGYFNSGGHRFMDDKIGGHGMVDLHKSIVVSCNTYYYQLANDLGIEGIAGFMAPFGFGERTGIDLPGEATGVLPSPEWKRKRFKKAEQQRWFGGETISVGIGQGYNAYTPLQLANALAALPWLFEFWALPHQIPPEGMWKTWMIMGGRGAGKTRAGAEWVRAQVEGSKPGDPGISNRLALVGETIDQVREVMIFGESGIMACTPPDRRPVWEAGRKRLVWSNGATAQARVNGLPTQSTPIQTSSAPAPPMCR